MPTTGFHSEWITIGQHRILLQCRASFPHDGMRLEAQLAVILCGTYTDDRARVVSIFYDDKACSTMVTFASTQEEPELEEAFGTVFHNLYNNGNDICEVEVVEEGDTGSDHYNRTEHLSVAAKVAADRWRWKDEEYQKDVKPPG